MVPRDGRIFAFVLGWCLELRVDAVTFRVSVGDVLFEDVGIFRFSGMLDFQMFGCWWIVTSLLLFWVG